MYLNLRVAVHSGMYFFKKNKFRNIELKPCNSIVLDFTDKDTCKQCLAERRVEVATVVRRSETFQCIENTALVKHLEIKREDS